ncbi:MAG: 50S ribosomal protein L25 [Pseudomonadota bacterium]
MTKTIDLSATERDAAGKGAARKARKAGLVPAVIYGQGKAPISISVEFNTLLKYLNKGGFKQAEINLDVAGTVHKVKSQDIQLHPVKHVPIHVDFLRVA